MSLLGQWTSSAAAAPARTRVPDGFGSVRTSPRLPAGFAKTFRSRFVQANGIRQQVVIGVKGGATAAGARLARDLVRLGDS
jgi:hypothetical protein